MDTFELKDIKPIPDPVYQYPDELRADCTPVVIDNGSYQCRVGWATDEKPRLTFKNLIAKQRRERGKRDGEIQIGNDITNIEAVRMQLKSPFDRNVVTHWEAQEQILDYVFTHLGIDTEGCVNHPVTMTEPLLNPNFSRHLLSELLFECYHIPSVAYGVDALFSFAHNHPTCEDALVISCGYHTTHIIPVLDGQVDTANCRRINLGGSEMVGVLHRLLQLKYPAHLNAVSVSRAEELFHEHCNVAVDYMAELRNWAKTDFYKSNVHCIQLPYTIIAAPTLTAEQQKERRKELARRLVEMNAKKREEKLAEDEDQLSQLLALQDLIEDGIDEEEMQNELAAHELSDPDNLDKTIIELRTRIEKTKQKIASVSAVDEVVEEPKPKNPRDSHDPKERADFEEWIAGVKLKRQEILTRRAARRQRRQDMAKRRTAAAQERMRLISQLARKEKRDDNFGIRDEDWDVYKAINKEGGDSDSEVEQEKLSELEQVLKQHDPEFVCSSDADSQKDVSVPERHQLHVGTERIRSPELLFQPSVIGMEQAGIAETLDFVLKRYPPEVQSRLVSNVFLTGGCANFSGLVPRIEKELLEMRPFQSAFKVTRAREPSLDAWFGARAFTLDPNSLPYFITRAEYDEMGGEYLKEHYASNKYYPSPTPLPLLSQTTDSGTASTLTTLTPIASDILDVFPSTFDISAMEVIIM